MNHKAISVN
uniref:Uncharacterized protein n=1 Tax=Arundo donax TaxID=35708 RepID=A0A0A9EE85_ARUDO